ncbi:MAG TPA: hypothetical protein VGI39_39130 [Polyangiaceae bacterium]|jgi:hypothetical protein
MNETKLGDIKLTREELETAAKAIDSAMEKIETILRHAADPKDRRKDVVLKASETYAHFGQSKKLLLELYSSLGVRPT